MEASVKVAVGCEYVNAGTVEFLYEDDEFYYLEMNTRLQVEHPVTELVTGIDLVAEQIRVAAGEPLRFTQSDVSIRGHAIEARINAEDPAQGKFLPSPGIITELKVPQGAGVRWDGGYEQGDEVSQYYDNLVGKLVVWAPDRDAAIARMLRALDELTISGIATTTPAQVAIFEHEDFKAARHSTKWVEETLDLSNVQAAAQPASSSDDEQAVRRDVDVEVNGRHFSVSVWVPDNTAPSNRTRRQQKSSASAAPSSGSVTVPMQGNIIKVLVEPGDTVAADQAVVVLEAMKMENNISCEVAGTVAEVKVSVGDSVGAGDVVVVVTPTD
ncbi:MAG: biotin/lipoyl-containing protein [Acidimicrobiales bacterium]